MTQSNPIRVLLVDDHMVVRSGLSTVLSVYDDLKLVGEAGDGEEAIRLCDHLQPDVILMDLLMPKMDGVALYKAIRRIPDFALIPIVFFTASRIQESDIQEYLDLGAAGVIAKPFDPMTLSSQIQAIWERKQKS